MANIGSRSLDFKTLAWETVYSRVVFFSCISSGFVSAVPMGGDIPEGPFTFDAGGIVGKADIGQQVVIQTGKGKAFVAQGDDLAQKVQQGRTTARGTGEGVGERTGHDGFHSRW